MLELQQKLHLITRILKQTVGFNIFVGKLVS